jgi:hypothetical protein
MRTAVIAITAAKIDRVSLLERVRRAGRGERLSGDGRPPLISSLVSPPGSFGPITKSRLDRCSCLTAVGRLSSKVAQPVREDMDMLGASQAAACLSNLPVLGVGVGDVGERRALRRFRDKVGDRRVDEDARRTRGFVHHTLDQGERAVPNRRARRPVVADAGRTEADRREREERRGATRRRCHEGRAPSARVESSPFLMNAAARSDGIARRWTLGSTGNPATHRRRSQCHAKTSTGHRLRALALADVPPQGAGAPSPRP